MANSSIAPSTLTFLKDLSKNNTREWFTEHKDRYVEAHENVVAFADALLEEMRKHDELDNVSGKKSVYRIYRDVRFSKDKVPYKNHFGGYLRRATKMRRGGYYFHIEPGAAFVGGGFWMPNSDDIKHIRAHIAQDDAPLRIIIADPTFVKTFGTLDGEGVKTAPKGYSKDHPAIDLLRKKQFLVGKSFTDKEMKSKDFAKEVTLTFNAMRPFFDYMSEILTTDLNGAPLEG